MTVSAKFDNNIQFYYSLSNDSVELLRYVGKQSDLVIPTVIEGVDVIAIKDYCFENCLSLKTLVLPDQVKSLGEGAFNRCLNLESVTLSAKIHVLRDHTFANCVNLKAIIIPFGIQKIEKECFRDNFSLRHIEIPGSINRIEEGTFASAHNLESVTLELGVVEIGPVAFYNCSNLRSVILPDSVEVLKRGCFAECSNMTKLILPKNLESIEELAFKHCTSLEEINLPENVLTVNESAFEECKSVKKVLWQGKFKTVDFWPTKGSYALEEIVFGDNVTEININNTFGDLKKVRFPAGLKKLSYSIVSEFYAKQCSGDFAVLNDSMLIKYKGKDKHVVLPQNITELLDHCFAESDLSHIVLNDKIKEIPQACFRGCKSLIEFRFPETIHTIQKYAFYECSNLKKVVLSEGIREIRAYAFSGCPLLSEITLPNSLEIVENDLFSKDVRFESFTIPPLLDNNSFHSNHGWNDDVPFCFHVSEIHFSNVKLNLPLLIHLDDAKKIFFHNPEGQLVVFDASSIAEKYRSFILPTLVMYEGNFEFDIFSLRAQLYGYRSDSVNALYTDYLKEFVIDANLEEFISKKTDLARLDPEQILRELIVNQDTESVKRLLANKYVRVHINESIDEFMKVASENQAVEVITILMNTFYLDRDKYNKYEL